MSARMAAPRAALAGLMALLLMVGALGGALSGTARADSAPLDPSNPATPPTVTADPLPTVQINGVAWSQAVVGNTVYVGGDFSTARPAGAAPGTQETTRKNLLAYDIRTGQLVTSFAHDLNGQVLTVTASPDGSRVYVGGDFTEVNGQGRWRIAAFNTSTGQLVDNFRPVFGSRVAAIAATNETVYAGGWFSNVGSVTRERLAAVSAADGSLRPWTPSPGAGPTDGNRPNGGKPANRTPANDVTALALTSGGQQVVVGGRFYTLNGVQATGVGALDAVTGETRPFAVNQILTNHGANASINSLSYDGATVYGTAYDFYGPGNFEGTFAVNADGGAVKWIADCHGDHYSSYASGGSVYTAGHAHSCGNIGGFPEENPRIHQYATALSAVATGTVGNGTLNNSRLPDGSSSGTLLRGKPAPTLQHWYPTFWVGSYTNQWQAGWHVTGNDQYLVYAGEFTAVNSSAQQGLVRFARAADAPNKVAPKLTPELTPELRVVVGNAVRVGWKTVYDRDNANLTYRVYREGTEQPLHEVTQSSIWWSLPSLAFIDTEASPGTHRYRVTATDPAGNRVTSAWSTVEVPEGDGTPPRTYALGVLGDGASNYWSLGETSGSTARDQAGTSDMLVRTTWPAAVTMGQSGALGGDADTAFSFPGEPLMGRAHLATQTAVPGPNVFSIEAWFQTTSRAGGKIVGFGDKTTGNSSNYDRHVYMDNQGRLLFGVYPGAERVVQSEVSYADGAWHHVVASLSPAGMALYVDGQLVGSRTDTVSAQAYNGHWRIGGDSTWGSGTRYFSGVIDEVAIYPSALSADTVADHYALGTTGEPVNDAPTASFTETVTDLTASFDASASTDGDGTVQAYAWDFGDGETGTGAMASHTYRAAGTYAVTLTVTDDDGATATVERDVTVTEPLPNVAPVAAFTATVADLTASFDASASSDSDGDVVSFAWDFGDGSTGTGATVSHPYAAAGTYDVTLTVTDDEGATSTSEQSVTLEEGAATPFATDAFERSVTGGWGAADSGGAWTVIGGAANASVAGGDGVLTGAPSRSVGAQLPISARDVSVRLDLALQNAPTGGGTFTNVAVRRIGTSDYRARLWFANTGAAYLSLARVVSGVETVLTPQVRLPGSYTAGDVLRLRLDAEGTGTSTLRAKAWPVTGVEPATWQVTATDDSAVLQAPGSLYLLNYISGSAGQQVLRYDDLHVGPLGSTPVPENVAPSASFAATTTGLVAAVDASGSTDPDGSVVSYAWNFGDQTTATGVTASHTYATAGTYAVSLTVTDDDGAVGTVTQNVTVTAPSDPGEPVVFAADAFERSVNGGWGDAALGGVWGIVGGAANAAVSEGVGLLTGASGRSVGANLPISVQDVSAQLDVALQNAPSGGGSYWNLAVRRIGTSDYRLRLWFSSAGVVHTSLAKVVSGVETVLTPMVRLPGTYTAGDVLRLRLEAEGSGTTSLRAKAWAVTGAEPADWQLSVTDDAAELQAPGSLYLLGFTSGSATRSQVIRVDNLHVGPIGSTGTED